MLDVLKIDTYGLLCHLQMPGIKISCVSSLIYHLKAIDPNNVFDVVRGPNTVSTDHFTLSGPGQ
jgi:hypothetical protein